MNLSLETPPPSLTHTSDTSALRLVAAILLFAMRELKKRIADLREKWDSGSQLRARELRELLDIIEAIIDRVEEKG